jgi:signal transduction histidine kinase
LKSEKHTGNAALTSPLPAFFSSLALQISLVCALTWLVTTGDQFMPRLFLDDLSSTSLNYYAAGILVLISLLLLLLMWVRRTSALDVWIMVVICMLISEMTLVAFGLTSRFYLGWYVSRSLAVAVSTVVLIALLSETMRLHVALAHANIMLERERRNKLLNLQVATSSIAHEVRQPLSAVVSRAAAGRRWLERNPPDVSMARESFDHVEQAGLRANEVLASVRRLFQDTDRELESIDVNNLVLEGLQLLREHLNDHSIKTDIKLASEPLLVMGHRLQLQEVILNVVNNAIDAMAHIKVDRRTLKVRTKSKGDKTIVIEIDDSGRGIDADRLDQIFEPFVTTKSGGMGLGLAICSTIIQRHGGQLTASSGGENRGSLFKISLPAGKL